MLIPEICFLDRLNERNGLLETLLGEKEQKLLIAAEKAEHVEDLRNSLQEKETLNKEISEKLFQMEHKVNFIVCKDLIQGYLVRFEAGAFYSLYQSLKDAFISVDHVCVLLCGSKGVYSEICTTELTPFYKRLIVSLNCYLVPLSLLRGICYFPALEFQSDNKQPAVNHSCQLMGCPHNFF